MEPAGQAPYFVEVKTGYSGETVVRHLAREYGSAHGDADSGSKVVLVLDRADRADWIDLERQIEAALRPGLDLEIWDEGRLLALLADRFGVRIPQITPDNLLDVRQADRSCQGIPRVRRRLAQVCTSTTR